MKLYKILMIASLVQLFLLHPQAKNTYNGKAFNTFYGYSNVHDFVGTVDSTPFRVNLDKDMLDFEVFFPVIKMDTKKDKRNRQMFGMFDQKQFANIITKFSKLSLKKLLEFKDFEHDIIINIKSKDYPAKVLFKNITNQNHTLEFDVECTLQLNEIGLRAPSMMFGMVKVKNKVVTKTHFELKKSSLAIIKEQLQKIDQSK